MKHGTYKNFQPKADPPSTEKIFLIVFALTLIGLPLFSFAQEQQNYAPPNIFITELNIASQTDEKIEGSFVLQNNTDIPQGGLNYTIWLLREAVSQREVSLDEFLKTLPSEQHSAFPIKKTNNAGGEMKFYLAPIYKITDFQNYSEKFSLLKKEAVTKKFVYQIPKNINEGKYVLRISVNKDSEEAIFSQKEIYLKGGNNFIEIKELTVSQTIKEGGKIIEKTFGPQEGPTFNPDEKVKIKAVLYNPHNQIVVVTPKIEIYRRNQGAEKPVFTFEKEEFSLNPKSSKTFVYEIEANLKPTVYELVLKFFKENHPVSEAGLFRFVVAGESAEILEISFDKDGYFKNDKAIIKTLIAGSADQNALNQTGGTELKDISLIIDIFDKNNELCGSRSQTISDAIIHQSVVSEISIEKDCLDPTANIKIFNSSGELLHSKSSKVLSGPETKQKLLNKYLWMVGIIIFIVLLLSFVIYRNKIFKKSSVGIFLFTIIVAAGLFSNFKTANAAITANVWIDSPADGTLLPPGSSINISGGFISNNSVCKNSPHVVITVSYPSGSPQQAIYLGQNGISGNNGSYSFNIGPLTTRGDNKITVENHSFYVAPDGTITEAHISKLITIKINQPPNPPGLDCDGCYPQGSGATIQVGDAGDPDNGPRNYRDYLVEILNTAYKWGWTRDTSFTSGGLASGSYTCRAQAGDGWEGSAPTTKTFTINSPPATPNCRQDKATLKVGESQGLYWPSNDPDSCNTTGGVEYFGEIYRDGNKIGDTGWTKNTGSFWNPDKPGGYVWRVKARDGYNESAFCPSQSFAVTKEETHTICNTSNQCVTVQGPGSNLCSNDSNCTPELCPSGNQKPECKSGATETKTESCTVDNCPGTKTFQKTCDADCWAGWTDNGCVKNDPNCGVQSCSPSFVIAPSATAVKVGENTQLRGLYDSDGLCSGSGEENKSGAANWNADASIIDYLAYPNFLDVKGKAKGTTQVKANYNSIPAEATVEVTETTTPPPAGCGDKTCDAGKGESCSNCEADCGKCPPPALSLSVNLTANPSSGNSPLNSTLTANVSGDAQGSMNYTFYCDRSDSGTNITSGYVAKYDNVNETTKTAQCSYSVDKNYTAKVIVERGSARPAEMRVPVNVSCSNQCSPSGTKQCAGNSSYQVCGNYDSDSCLEWSAANSCPSGDVCRNGNCYTPPNISFSTSPSTIKQGENAVLTWNSQNADSCSASDGWSGSKPASGSQTVSPKRTTDYTLTCSGSGGQISKSVTVTVKVIPGFIEF